MRQVEISLTEEGQERWEEVAALVHAHARLVRQLPAEDARRAWEEQRNMGAIHLRFQQVVKWRLVPKAAVGHICCCSLFA